MTVTHCRKLNEVWLANGGTQTIHKVGGKLILINNKDRATALIRLQAQADKSPEVNTEEAKPQLDIPSDQIYAESETEVVL